MVKILLGAVVLGAAYTGSATAQDTTAVHEASILERLNVPTNVLPAGCELASQGGVPMVPLFLDTNPTIFTDSMAILAVSNSVLGIPENPDAANQSIAEMGDARMEWLGGLVAKIEAAYTGFYYNKDHKEIGVLALLFKEEPVDVDAEALTRMFGGPLTVKGPLVFTSWADGEDRSCYDAIRAYLEDVSMP